MPIPAPASTDEFGALLTSLAGTTVKSVTAPIFVGTGNGLMSGLAITQLAVVEDFTVTFTSATAFDVTGTVSGLVGAGTVGVLFNSTEVEFAIAAGTTPFDVADEFTFSVTSAAKVGSKLRDDIKLDWKDDVREDWKTGIYK